MRPALTEMHNIVFRHVKHRLRRLAPAIQTNCLGKVS
jgi:hypothetical protein